MKIAAEELAWHDAGIDAIAFDEPGQWLTFEVEVSIFDSELGIGRANQPDGFVFELSGEFLLGYGHGVLQCESH